MFSSNSNKNQNKTISEDIKKSACLKIKKAKSKKEKFFVLRKETSIGPARLEYYDSERKYKNGSACKCSIILKDCFSINKKCGLKDEHLIGLYTKEDCFTILLDNEAQFNDWLQALLELKTGDEAKSQIRKPNYERVWQVTISKAKNERENLASGIYRLCLTSDKKLHLIKVGSSDKNPELFELPLSCVRRLCHSKKYFNVELGRGSAIGPGNLWMLTDDNATSHDMHEAILRKMDRSSRSNESEPIARTRSASISENSKVVMNRRTNRTDNLSTTTTSQATPVSVTTCQANSLASFDLYYTTISIRERCDSLPLDFCNNNRGKAKEGTHAWPPSSNNELKSNSGINGWASYSPPSNNPLSPSGCSTDSIGSSLSEEYDPNMINSSDYYVATGHVNRESAAIPSEPPIREEEVIPDDYLLMEFGPNRKTSLASLYSHSSIPQKQWQQQKRSSLNLKLRPSNNPRSPPLLISPLLSNSHSSEKKDETEAPYLSMSPGMEWIESTEKSKRCDKSLNNINPVTLSAKEDDSTYVPMAPLSQQTSSEVNLPKLSTQASNDLTITITTTTAATGAITNSTPSNKSSITSTPATFMSSASESISEKDLSSKQNQTQDDYLDLSTLSASLPQIDSGPNAKRPILVTGPQSSLKAKLNEEFRLEKVKSYFSPSEEEDSYDYIKPVRAYSMGSRPLPREGNITSKIHIIQGYSCSSQNDNQLYSYSNTTKCDPQMRVRSFSMGSQNVEGRRLISKKKDNLQTSVKK